jgi:hypothetical protein
MSKYCGTCVLFVIVVTEICFADVTAGDGIKLSWL